MQIILKQIEDNSVLPSTHGWWINKLFWDIYSTLYLDRNFQNLKSSLLKLQVEKLAIQNWFSFFMQLKAQGRKGTLVCRSHSGLLLFFPNYYGKYHAINF